ncbi:hypothetical protein [Marilutibacter chinensis]|uniref:hypothetical protein n=1 Tax=Marilutibacter chinensis TaxID=2912247 RepID=UPI001F42942F|nr:hypothetical protein [Lysobacter chinensis]
MKKIVRHMSPAVARRCKAKQSFGHLDCVSKNGPGRRMFPAANPLSDRSINTRV